jgi:hypothetical protein
MRSKKITEILTIGHYGFIRLPKPLQKAKFDKCIETVAIAALMLAGIPAREVSRNNVTGFLVKMNSATESENAVGKRMTCGCLKCQGNQHRPDDLSIRSSSQEGLQAGTYAFLPSKHLLSPSQELRPSLSPFPERSKARPTSIVCICSSLKTPKNSSC